MRVLVRHGHYAFFPGSDDERSRFQKLYKMLLYPDRDFFTFQGLVGAQNYSIAGTPWLDTPALATHEGEPWEVMRANGFVFNISLGLVVPKETILTQASPIQSGDFFISRQPLLQAGARDSKTFLPILSYEGTLDLKFNILRLRSFANE